MAKSRSFSDDCIYQKTTLRNGLRVLTENTPSVRSVSLGVWIDVGSRHEPSQKSGVSHLIEHMVFKGTKKRSAKQIASSLESLGGSLNAFTSREHTCYTARFLDDHLDAAIDVLADLTCNATMTTTNLKREKLVICEEIKESIANPSDHIHDIFAETYWRQQSLGRPIMGTVESVTAIPRKTILSYINNHYRSGSIVIAASGSVSHRKLVKLARDKFYFPSGNATAAEKACDADDIRINLVPSNNDDQTHLCIGYPGLPFTSKDKIPTLALTTYLGGGMSSVLFQKIREERGLAYSVYAFHDCYRDAGVLGIYLATDKQRLQEAFEIVQTEITKIRDRRISSTRLDQIKQQIKGQITLGMEFTASRMNRLARLELLLGTYYPMNKLLREIDQVTPSSVQEVANRIFDDSKLAVAVLGASDRQAIENVIHS